MASGEAPTRPVWLALHHGHGAERGGVLTGAGMRLMPCFMGDSGPGLRRAVPPVATLRRDIWLVVHRDMHQNARVRAVLHSIDELIQRERPLMAGEGLASAKPAPSPPTPAPKRPAAGGRKASGRAS